MDLHRSRASVLAFLLLASAATALPKSESNNPVPTTTGPAALNQSHASTSGKAARRAANLAKEAAAQAARRARELRGVPDDGSRQIDPELRRRVRQEPNGRSRVIVELKSGQDLSAKDLTALDGKLGRRLRSFNGQLVELPNGQLKKLARLSGVASVHHDRAVALLNSRTAISVGARTAQLAYGYTGSGVGVAVIDSGITSWHDDLTSNGATSYPYGNQRVAAFVDFVNNQSTPYDGNGHGTHVAGTIAGNGYASYGFKAGMAPGAHLVVLKVLDENGRGTISNIIAAVDYVVAHKHELNIRVVNLSIGAGIYESYETDPLTLAVKRAVDAGIVVVTAAGNLGKAPAGGRQYGGITAPGNAPWVITVGASSTSGTIYRTDDEVGSYSSRGPTFIDYAAKPDLVAPGTGTFSLADPTSTLVAAHPDAVQAGYRPMSYLPYLALSGTSMAAPVVTGSVALMIEANPSLTPSLVKAILQYTAQRDPQYDGLTEGAGFLNTMGAVTLARSFAIRQPGAPYPNSHNWSHQLIWGNHRIGHGVLLPNANAWNPDVVWGSAFDALGDNIVWGSAGTDFDNIVWGSSLDNIVWGSSLDNIVWGSFGIDNIVWGSLDADNIVWGSDCGGADCDNVVWGSLAGIDNIVWGSSAAENADSILWGSALDLDNIVWGSGDLDNIVWGSSDNNDVLWGSPTDQLNGVWPDEIDFVLADPALWETLFLPPPAPGGSPLVEEPIAVAAPATTEPAATPEATGGSVTTVVEAPAPAADPLPTTETPTTTTAPTTSNTSETSTPAVETVVTVGGGL